LNVKKTKTYTNRDQVKVSQTFDVSSGSVLMAKSEKFYDSWGQAYETRTFGISGGTENGYSTVREWRNGRGLVIKTLSEGKVFNKLQYDGADRVTNMALSYDAAETTYGGADDLLGDTVMEETRKVYDSTGAVELDRNYQRKHNGTLTGSLRSGQAATVAPSTRLPGMTSSIAPRIASITAPMAGRT
jgi:hypothetical protein